MLVGFVLVAIYVIATRSEPLTGDQVVYDEYGVLFTEGKLWYTTVPFGVEHASAWKAPGYPAWVGFWYAIVGTSHVALGIVQAVLLAPLTVALAWLLGRRLFGARVATASAWVVALFPLSWEYFGMLFPEALAIPLTLAVLLVVLDREPTPARAAAAGALLGLSLLVRPTAFVLVAAIAAAWLIAMGLRRGAAMTGLALVVAALVVLPWTVRNVVVLDAFVPLSIQDSAVYGTFNKTAAEDPDRPYAWRPVPSAYREELTELRERRASEPEIRSEFYRLAWDYIRHRPWSIPLAFYHNGIRRFWDLRSPGDALDEVEFQGRSRGLRIAGLAMYYVLLPLALVGLWRSRRRREIWAPIAAMALAASLAFTVIAGTRYRAPLEPVIAILACSLLAGPARDGRQPEKETSEQSAAAASVPSRTL